jgi:alpha-1,2-glucosyltransferase
MSTAESCLSKRTFLRVVLDSNGRRLFETLKLLPCATQDEIFHAPQTQKYCQGRLSEWDPKITTFPGLYLLAAPYAVAVNWMQRVLLPSSPETACTIAVLRSINILFAAMFFAVFQLLYRKLQPHKSPEFAALMVS